MATLYLALKGEYFDAIKAGEKLEEYRYRSPYWRRRLEGRTYDAIELVRGYAKAGDTERRLRRPWRGYRETTITHEHFGPNPVEVFAIDVRPA